MVAAFRMENTLVETCENDYRVQRNVKREISLYE